MAISDRVESKFEQRRQRGLEFSESLKSYLLTHPRCVYIEDLGYETKFSRRAITDLSRSEDEEAHLLRFMPDYLLRTPQRFYFIEVKNGLRIERNAWDWYGNLYWLGINVVIYFQHRGVWYWGYWNKIRFADSHKEVMKYGSRAFRVVEEDWIRPGFKQASVKKSNMSGCDYKLVAIESLKRVGGSKA